MELELQKQRLEGYRSGAPLLLTQEETAETVVPDYSPDVARIVEVGACLRLRSRTVADGRLTASGTVALTLLYMAEGANGLRSFEYAIPFEQKLTLPDGCEDACLEGRVCGAEARLLNPRKLFTRVNIEWRATPYCRASLTTCGEIVDQKQYAIQMLCEKHDVSLIRSVGSRDFIFADELTLPGGREAVGELLSSRVKLRVTEAKSLGTKVVLKGVACLALLYAAEDGKLCAYSEELPFSQILDGLSEEDGDYNVSAALSLTDSEIHSGAEGRIIGVKLFLSAFLVLRSQSNVCCISDLYSTAYDLDAQFETLELQQEPVASGVTQTVREQLDTGAEVKCVLEANVCFGGVSVNRGESGATVRAPATVSVLYLDEGDVPLSIERRVEVTAEADADAGARVSVEEVCAGDITANINAGGIELRFPAEFTIVSAAAPMCRCLTGLSAEKTEGGAGASLVLRALQEGETLWDIAKQYRTTAEEILAANELTENSLLEAGRMLLIPRTR